MNRKTTFLVILLVSSIGLSACQRLEPEFTREGELPFEQSRFSDAVPLDYGALVGVTPHPETAHWAALWFEKPDRTIAVVWVNVVNGEIKEDVCLIPRR